MSKRTVRVEITTTIQRAILKRDLTLHTTALNLAIVTTIIIMIAALAYNSSGQKVVDELARTKQRYELCIQDESNSPEFCVGFSTRRK